MDKLTGKKKSWDSSESIISESGLEADSYSEENFPTKNKRGAKKMILPVIIILIFLGVLYYSIMPVRFLPRFTPGYQAVFLTNGQVYFGKLYKENSQYPVLREVYYLQVTQPPQPIQAGESPPTNINLVKLGGELHGPQDEMRISRGQILFVEDLKSDSRVVEAINQLIQSAK